MKGAVQPPQIDLSTCEKLVDSATAAAASVFKACVASQTGPVPPAQLSPAPVDFNPLSNSFAALSASIGHTNDVIAEIALLIAIIGLVAAVGWMFFVRLDAQRVARETAEKEAKLYLDNWSRDVAPRYLTNLSEMVFKGRTDSVEDIGPNV